MVFIGKADRLAIEEEGNNVVAYGRYLFVLHELMHGRLHSVITHSREALAELAIGLGKYTPHVMAIVVILAEALYERNELKEARDFLEPYRSVLSTNLVFPDVTLIGLRTLARIDFANGRTQEASGDLLELERVAAYAGLPRLGASVRMEKIRLALEQGDVDKAQRISREWDDSRIWSAFEGYTLPGNESDTFELSKIRLMIARGKGKEALDLLRPELKRAEAAGLLRKGLKLRLLMVKAYAATNQGRAALRSLREAVLIFQNENFVRSYVDEGQPITDLLLELRTTLKSSAAEGGDIDRDYLDRLLLAMGHSAQALPDEETTAEQSFVEPLSSREIKVLEKLAHGLSNDDIADQCCISVNTVRFHLRNINAKLGTKSRTEALVVARKIGAIP
jgi:LuxR family maltose regulon positive regulatory protein